MEGAITRYQIIYVGGFPKKPKKKSDSLPLGFNVMEDSFFPASNEPSSRAGADILLREKKILNKFRGEEKEDIKFSDDDVFAQIEKLASLKEKGLISEEEFNQKKTVLLEKL